MEPEGKLGFHANRSRGVLGPLLASQILPKKTWFLTAGEFSALNLFFAVFLIFGALVYNVGRTRRTLFFLLGMWIAVGAIFGQLMTVFLVLAELSAQADITGLAVFVLCFVFAIVFIFALFYTGKIIVDALAKKEKEGEEAEPAVLEEAQASIKLP